MLSAPEKSVRTESRKRFCRELLGNFFFASLAPKEQLAQQLSPNDKRLAKKTLAAATEIGEPGSAELV